MSFSPILSSVDGGSPYAPSPSPSETPQKEIALALKIITPTISTPTLPTPDRPAKKKCPPLVFSPQGSPVRKNLQEEGSPGLANLAGDLPESSVSAIDYALKQGTPLVQPNTSGKNGSFLVYSDEEVPIAILKPRENERGAVRQLGSLVTASKEGIEAGESAFTEYVAYKYAQKLLTLFFGEDSNAPIVLASTGYGKFASTSFYRDLPNTTGAPFPVAKHGSIHLFLPNCTHFSAQKHASLFNAKTAAALAVLDMALCNTDRNGENLLIQTLPNNSQRLVLIDHGLCWPRKGESSALFVWRETYSSLLAAPIDESVKQFITDLVPLKVVTDDLSHIESFDKERLLANATAIELLQAGAKAGLNLYEISILMEGTPVDGILGNPIAQYPDNAVYTIISRGGTAQELIERYQKALDESADQQARESIALKDPKKLYEICIQAKASAFLHSLPQMD